MFYIFYKKNKACLCFKSASVFLAEGGVGSVPSLGLWVLLAEGWKWAWGTGPCKEAGVMNPAGPWSSKWRGIMVGFCFPYKSGQCIMELLQTNNLVWKQTVPGMLAL
jgi:hypothetical protein